MTWTNKVIWMEGMFLQPQHLQQHERFFEQQTQMRLGATAAYGWGHLALSLDSAALNLGKVAVTSASGVMPDGLAFDIPGQDPAPAALDVPPDARDQLVVLAISLQRPGVAETDAESDAGRGTRDQCDLASERSHRGGSQQRGISGPRASAPI